MFKCDAVSHFGTSSKVAQAAGVERSAVSQWKILVPERCAQRLADASEGALHYDKNLYDEYRKKKRLSRKASTEPKKDSD
ncbi:Cro/CI family transcriptional regulator [Cronobacter sakazakii]|uniref:Cro/CI family transcriptional regulator n=1 Tax=Cronobacter sakazakii TaxID=28141 RepID=UPI0028958CC9|nr:Cro/CI family transcriptional regulator [Cronobacter sakazakii]ELY2855237.1 transcriptional regulator [Cronobacter dublinensis]ELZ9929960.1 transcriptional regulator [Cronobacter malonaticus]EJH8725052.1 transcriptional regulator [Cronobacter sakazakii]EJJ0563757.1 transcriptional regulator [Cronobacter sakazakii]EJJ0567677.1 transcriptional regulator [Cronobacter sakazakii]